MKTADASNRVPPAQLKTWQEYSAYLAKHLKPVRFGPKEQPIYDAEQIATLNIIHRIRNSIARPPANSSAQKVKAI